MYSSLKASSIVQGFKKSRSNLVGNVGFGTTATLLTFSGASNGSGYAGSDSSNNIYIVGNTGASPNRAGQVIKTSTTGTIGTQYKSDIASYNDETLAVAVDSSGNIFTNGYTTAYSSYGWVVTKSNSSGALQWNKSFYTGGYDFGYGIALTSTGNPVLVGVISGLTSTYDQMIIRMDTNGNVLFGKRIYGSSTTDAVFDVAIDGSGNIILAGYHGNQSTGKTQCTLLSYQSNASTQNFATRFGSGSDTYNEQFQSVAVDSSNNIYVSGHSNSTGTNRVFVVKYNSSGTLQWQRVLSGPTGIYSAGITTDSSGNSYVAITAETTPYFVYLVKYNSSGVLQWQRSFSQPDATVPNGITLLPNGNIACTGYTTVSSVLNMFALIVPPTGGIAGTTVNNGVTYTFAASSLTDAAGSYSTSTPPLGDTDYTPTTATPSLSNSATTLTSNASTVS